MQSLQHLYDGIRVSDDIVAKSLGVREVAQIARIETLLRTFVHAEWVGLSREAAKQSAQAVNGSSQKNVSLVMKRIDRTMGQWSNRVRSRFLRDVENIYELARVAAHRKGTGQTRSSLQYNTKPFSHRAVTKMDTPGLLPSFDAVDEAAVSQLRRTQTFWIGAHYEQNVRNTIRDVTRSALVEQGSGQGVAGRALQSKIASSFEKVTVPGGFSGTAKSYFEGLVANAATVARTQGQLRSFEMLGFERYQIVNPEDRRTCPICTHMDGKIFMVAQGRSQMDEELEARSPSDVRRVHPWHGVSRLKSISPRAGAAGKSDADKLAGSGFSMPDFHFRCRCSVDVIIS